jgi:hypothetical protein
MQNRFCWEVDTTGRGYECTIMKSISIVLKSVAVRRRRSEVVRAHCICYGNITTESLCTIYIC